MKIRTLNKHLGPGIKASRQGRLITIRASGLEYRVAGNDSRSEAALADHIKSKIPIAIIKPRPS